MKKIETPLTIVLIILSFTLLTISAINNNKKSKLDKEFNDLFSIENMEEVVDYTKTEKVIFNDSAIQVEIIHDLDFDDTLISIEVTPLNTDPIEQE